MTNLTQVTKHAKIIAGAGGPEWYDWCSLEDSAIEVATGDDYGDDSWCYCLPACEAAVVMYCGDVQAFWNSKGGDNDAMKHCTDIDPNPWMWELYGVLVWESGTCNTQLAASVALIAAVAEQIGGSDD